DARAEPLVLLGMAQEVDDLRELLLRLVDPGHVGERHPIAARLVALGARAAEAPEHPLRVAGTAHQEDEQPDEQDRRTEAEEEALPPRDAARQGLRVDDDALLLEQVRER